MSVSAPDGLAGVGRRVLVVGFARTGAAVARVLAPRGCEVVAVDDAPSTAARRAARDLGVELFANPAEAELGALAAQADLVVVSPGVPPTHPVMALAPPGTVVSEIELAYRLGGPPIAAVTGTNGKTTVTSLVAAMLAESGIAARAAGNIGYPLVEAMVEAGLDVVVAEVSSFQLALTSTFRPVVGAWLNLAEDHLDWHGDLASYAAAKERIWANQDVSDVAVANAEDAEVASRARRVRSRLVTFGLDTGDFRCAGDGLVGPGGAVLARRADLVRDLPHDRANALAALAVATSLGADPLACARALASQGPLPHRVELVGRVDGVDYYDDSKATTPSAVLAALAGFTSVVLVAGGRNKGLDLGAIPAHLRRLAGEDPGPGDAGDDRARPVALGGTRLRAVVAIGESAPDIERAFAPDWPVVVAASMDEAVAAAAGLARDGDAVLLSPGCASFDWYGSYEERGADFARAVRALGPGVAAR